MSNIVDLTDTVSLAFHAMILLARHPEQRISSTEMADVFDASEHTIAIAMKRLVQAGLAGAVRGAKGGFWLTADPSKVTLLDIYELFEGPLAEGHCLLDKPVCMGEKCVMRGLVNRLNREAHKYLSQTTLYDLAETVQLGDEKWPRRAKQGRSPTKRRDTTAAR